ncbi:hypothetical protein GGR52DRAFT_260312 [Hypoxylon sp. FL1284]|nr:hypothetical protein GGR52DRAFT_260312 [Hypoxylon sp. FL1284]
MLRNEDEYLVDIAVSWTPHTLVLVLLLLLFHYRLQRLSNGCCHTPTSDFIKSRSGQATKKGGLYFQSRQTLKSYHIPLDGNRPMVYSSRTHEVDYLGHGDIHGYMVDMKTQYGQLLNWQFRAMVLRGHSHRLRGRRPKQRRSGIRETKGIQIGDSQAILVHRSNDSIL